MGASHSTAYGTPSQLNSSISTSARRSSSPYSGIPPSHRLWTPTCTFSMTRTTRLEGWTRHSASLDRAVRQTPLPHRPSKYWAATAQLGTTPLGGAYSEYSLRRAGVQGLVGR